MIPFLFPSDTPRFRRVATFDALVTTPLIEGVQGLCWERSLPGDFAEVVAQLGPGQGIVPLDETRLRALRLSAAGAAAVDQLVQDLQLLRERGLSPSLDCIHAYPRDETAGVVATDVYSYHADRAPVAADTYLCTYHGAPSEALRHDDARRKIDDPATRAALLEEFGGQEGEEFREYLAECCYDLHYAPRPGATPISFGLGNLWRIAIDYPGNPVPPCVHRAPLTGAGDSPRLLLIS